MKMQQDNQGPKGAETLRAQRGVSVHLGKPLAYCLGAIKAYWSPSTALGEAPSRIAQTSIGAKSDPTTHRHLGFLLGFFVWLQSFLLPFRFVSLVIHISHIPGQGTKKETLVTANWTPPATFTPGNKAISSPQMYSTWREHPKHATWPDLGHAPQQKQRPRASTGHRAVSDGCIQDPKCI